MMMYNSGAAFLLKIGDGSETPTYKTVAGLRITQMAINGGPVATRGVDFSGARQSLSVSAAGIFTGSAAETSVRGHALAGTISDYELSFESGERLRGKFLVTRLDYAGDYNGERSYAINLESSGAITLL